MPSLIDIRRRIRSVRNTQQITKAMKMVSAAKLRRAQDRVIASRPYGAALRALLADVAAAAGADERVAAHPLLARRPERRVQLVLITSDKGLAAAFNANLTKAAVRFAEEHKPAATDFELIGRKGRDFFRKRSVPITGEHLGMAKVQYEDAAAIARKLMERIRNEEIDAVYLLYNEFKSVMAQRVVLTQVLPVVLPQQGEPVAALRGDRDLSRAAGIRRGRTRRAHDRHGRRHIQRGGHDREPDALHEPRPPGQHHQGNHRSSERRRRR